MTFKFKKNKIPYLQDFMYKVGIPKGIKFNVEILSKSKISLTANGYGQIGGNYGDGALFVLVSHLPKKYNDIIISMHGNANKKIPVECFSRVVGYFRPVCQWNKGKQEEFKERKFYGVGRNNDKKN